MKCKRAWACANMCGISTVRFSQVPCIMDMIAIICDLHDVAIVEDNPFLSSLVSQHALSA